MGHQLLFVHVHHSSGAVPLMFGPSRSSPLPELTLEACEDSSWHNKSGACGELVLRFYASFHGQGAPQEQIRRTDVHHTVEA